MMRDTDENKLINRYLLGELSEDELAQVEERYFADEDFFALVVDAENSLVDSYARGSFSAVERGKFERQFLTTPQRRQKIKFAQSLTRAIKETQTNAATNVVAVENERAIANRENSWWQMLAGIFNVQSPARAFGTAAVLLMIVGAGLFVVLQRGSNSTDIAKHSSQTIKNALSENNQQSNINNNTLNTNEVTDTNTSPQKPVNTQTKQQSDGQKPRNEKQSGDTTARPEKQIDNSSSRPEKSTPSSQQRPIIAFFLRPGLLRGEGERTQILIPAKANQIRLQLNLEENEYPRYRAAIQNPDGKEIWSGRVQIMKKGDKTVSLLVPAKSLPKGDYRLILKGETAEGETETISEYPFSVEKK